eukprot:69312-Rhodomonas_salina.4
MSGTSNEYAATIVCLYTTLRYAATIQCPVSGTDLGYGATSRIRIQASYGHTASYFHYNRRQRMAIPRCATSLRTREPFDCPALYAGADVAYGPMRHLGAIAVDPGTNWVTGITLRLCSAMSGTGTAYGATHVLCAVRYSVAYQATTALCDVLMERARVRRGYVGRQKCRYNLSYRPTPYLLLNSSVCSYATSGTEGVHAPTHCP